MIKPLIGLKHTLSWACEITIDNKAERRQILSHPRFHVDYLDNGNMYVSDSILCVNGYMIVGEVLVRLGDGSVISASPIWLREEGFKAAGRFCNYEEDPRDG